MIISSYLRSVNISENGFEYYFSKRNIIRILKKIIPAYFFIAFVEVFIQIILKHLLNINKFNFTNSILDFFIWILTGLTGQGSYYVPIILQLIIFFPFIYYIFIKFKSKGIIVCFILNILYEIFVLSINLNPELYRLLIFRYTLMIGFGVYLQKNDFSLRDDYLSKLYFFYRYIIHCNQYLFL